MVPGILGGALAAVGSITDFVARNTPASVSRGVVGAELCCPFAAHPAAAWLLAGHGFIAVPLARAGGHLGESWPGAGRVGLRTQLAGRERCCDESQKPPITSATGLASCCLACRRFCWLMKPLDARRWSRPSARSSSACGSRPRCWAAATTASPVGKQAATGVFSLSGATS